MTEQEIREAIIPIEDPELHFSIVDMGLIYDIKVEGDETSGQKVKIKMTLTSPACPIGPQIMEEIKEVLAKKGLKEVSVELCFNPMWDPKTMASEEIRLALGIW